MDQNLIIKPCHEIQGIYAALESIQARGHIPYTIPAFMPYDFSANYNLKYIPPSEWLSQNLGQDWSTDPKYKGQVNVINQLIDPENDTDKLLNYGEFTNTDNHALQKH